MKKLGIAYQHATPQPMADQWWFWNCKNVPKELPKYLEPMTIDPMLFVGSDLTLEEAQSIIAEQNKCGDSIT